MDYGVALGSAASSLYKKMVSFENIPTIALLAVFLSKVLANDISIYNLFNSCDHELCLETDEVKTFTDAITEQELVGVKFYYSESNYKLVHILILIE